MALNKTFTYLFPLTGINISSTSGIINCYVDNDSLNLVLFCNSFGSSEIDPKINLGMMYLEKNLITSDNFLYSIPTSERILYFFKVSKEFENDKNLILKGKYSKISEAAKITILRFLNLLGHNMTSEVYIQVSGILYKSEMFRKKREFELGMTIEKHLELTSIFSDEEFITIKISDERSIKSNEESNDS